MAFTYYLPDEIGNKTEHSTTSNAVIIIGANGSGKSKLGAWIEQQNFEACHRIGAQRNLNFQENTPLKSYSQAEDIIFYGSTEPREDLRARKFYRWNNGKEYTTKLMNDFDDVLSALIALKNMDTDKFFAACKEAEKTESERPHTPITVIDTLFEIWDEVLPQRTLKLSDAKFTAVVCQNETEHEYSSNQMSDGERAVLYLAAQVLCVPKNKTLIIDEPEIHLHRSIMNRLWMSLEKHRPDCLFIYITHDTQFAAMHGNADKIWIKEFDGNNWKFEVLGDSNLPEELLFEILGNRRNVIFVEGEKNSYDTRLYSLIYPDYYVVACGSCTQVIARTKAFHNNPALHHCEVFGIIDRDYRSEHEIEAYKQDNIFVLGVAEVENLFLVEGLIRLMASHMGKDADTVFTDVKDYIIGTRYSGQIEKQICQSVVAQLKYQLSIADISKKNEAEAKAALNIIIQSIDYDTIKVEQETKFRTALNCGDYASVLGVFNEKNIVGSVGHFMGMQDKEYCNTVLALLRGDKREQIIAAVVPYLPTEIAR